MQYHNFLGIVIKNPDGKTTKKKWIFCQMYQGLKNSIQTPDNISRYEPREDDFLGQKPHHVFEYLAMVNAFLNGPNAVKNYPARYEIRVSGHETALACLAKAKKPDIKFYVTSTCVTLKYLSKMADIWKHIFRISHSMYFIGPLRRDFLKIIRLLLLSLFRGWEYVRIKSHSVRKKDLIFLAIENSIKNYSFPYMESELVDLRQLRLKDSLDFTHKSSFDEDLPFGKTVPDIYDKKLVHKAMDLYNYFRVVWNDANPIPAIANILNTTAQASILSAIPKSFIKEVSLSHFSYSLKNLEKVVNLQITYLNFSYIHLFDTLYAVHHGSVGSNHWWRKSLHVFFYRYFMDMFRTKNKPQIADALDLELQMLLCDWDFFPFIQSDRIWGNCDSEHKILRVFIVKDLRSVKKELMPPIDKGLKSIEFKSIAQNLFKTFLLDIWLDIDDYIMEIYGQLQEKVRLARNPNLTLSDLLESFQLQFLGRIGFPGKFLKVTKKAKDWTERFNHFFPYPIRNPDSGGYSQISRKSFAIKWKQVVDENDQSTIIKIIPELFSYFQKLEWLPNHQGVKAFWRKCRGKNSAEKYEIVKRADFDKFQSDLWREQISQKDVHKLGDGSTSQKEELVNLVDIHWIRDMYPFDKM